MTVSRRSSGLVLEDRSSLTAAPTELVDRSRYRNDGVYTLMNAAVRLPSRLWVHSNDGDLGDYIRITAPIGIAGLQGITLETWVLIHALPVANDYGFITLQLNAAPWQAGYIWINSADDKFRFSIKTITGGDQSIDSDSAGVIDTWYHIIGVYDGANIYQYINAVIQAGTAAITGNVRTPDNIFVTAGFTNQRSLNGQLALPHIYNYALNAGQVEKRFSQTVGWFR